jgi:hypothetical protein
LIRAEHNASRPQKAKIIKENCEVGEGEEELDEDELVN